MRVVLVGTAADRDRLRSQLEASIEVAGEFATIAAARAGGGDVDALLVAAGRRLGEPGDDIDDPLTPREIEVLDLLAEGLPNKAIARRLGISDQTVKFHVASVSSKLGAHNRTDAVRRAVRRGLVAL
jgi:two-component system nitrate/nitrite response regulator NarL